MAVVLAGLLAAPSARAAETTSTAPQVSDVQPGGGPVAGGNTVTIRGTGFTGATRVRFGLFNPATTFTVVDDTRIDAVAPPSPGPVDQKKNVNVLVSTPAGTSAAWYEAWYDYYPAPPEVRTVDPARGPGTEFHAIELCGDDLKLVTSIHLGSTTPDFTYSPWTGCITVSRYPGEFGTFEFVLATGGAWDDLATGKTFTAYNPTMPAVNDISPTTGRDLGGTGVWIAGSALSGTTAVRFGTTPATSFTVVSDTSIYAVAPPLTAKLTYAVFVETPLGTSPKGPPGSWYSPWTTASSVEGIAPNRGPAAGGDVITITGTGFTGATEVRFGTANPSPSFTVVSSTQIDAVAPPTPGHWGQDTLATVFVTTPGGTSGARPAAWYRYEAGPPQVSDLTVAHGPATGGTQLRILGRGFTGATAVRFGQQPATAVQVVSDKRIDVTSPVHTPGTVVNVFVETPRGTSPHGAPSFFWYDP